MPYITVGKENSGNIDLYYPVADRQPLRHGDGLRSLPGIMAEPSPLSNQHGVLLL